jgi:hypothetical protein
MELRGGGDDQPRPAIGLLGVAHPWRRPTETLLTEAQGVLQIEASPRGPPPDVEVQRPIRTMPPGPQLLRLARLAWQAAHLDEDTRPAHDGAPLTRAATRVGVMLGMQPRPGAHTHGAVLLVGGEVLGTWSGPGCGIGAGELRAVLTRTTALRSSHRRWGAA